MDATINSRRMQHAHMMNGIEDKRMRNYLRGLDKERRHVMRNTTQDIRMVGLTMDFIQASSGYSPEGLPSSDEEDEVQDVVEDDYLHVNPHTMVVCNPRRSRSAPGVARPKRYETRSAALVEPAPGAMAGDSKPPRKNRILSATTLHPPRGAVRRVATPTLLSGPEAARPQSRNPSSTEGFHQEDVHRLVQRPQSRETPTPGMPTQAWGPREGTDTPEPRLLANRGPTGSRATQISRAVQQVRALTATAKRMQNMTPSQALLMTNTLTSKQQETRDRLQIINEQEQRRLQEKLRYFYSKYPIGLGLPKRTNAAVK